MLEEIEMESMQKDQNILALAESIKEYEENIAIQEENCTKLSKQNELAFINERAELISVISE